MKERLKISLQANFKVYFQFFFLQVIKYLEGFVREEDALPLSHIFGGTPV